MALPRAEIIEIKRRAFIENAQGAFSFDERLSGKNFLRAQAGLGDVAGSIAEIEGSDHEHDSQEKRKMRTLRAMQHMTMGQMIDQMIADIDQQLEKIGIQISGLQKRQQEIAKEKAPLVQEREEYKKI